MEKKIICKQCGSVNILGRISESEDVIPCKVPEDLDWFLPMQKIPSDKGEPIYVDQQGKHMSKEQYIKTHNLDPEIAQKKMKRYIGEYIGESANKV